MPTGANATTGQLLAASVRVVIEFLASLESSLLQEVSYQRKILVDFLSLIWKQRAGKSALLVIEGGMQGRKLKIISLLPEAGG